MRPGNGRRPIGGGAAGFVEKNMLAIVLYEPSFGLYRLSEKVMHDVWVKVRSSWWRIVALLLASMAICGGLAYQVNLPTKDLVVFLLVIAAAVVVLYWTMPSYSRRRALQSSYSEGDLGHVGEMKMDSTGDLIGLNDGEGKEREEEADYIAVGYVPPDTLLEPRPACPLMVALLLVLFGALGAVLDYFIVGGGYRCGLAGAIFGGVVGFVRFGRKQYGVPKVIVASGEALRVARDTGMFFAAGGKHGKRCSTLELLNEPPPRLKKGESWDDYPDYYLVPCDPTSSSTTENGVIVYHTTGWKVYVKPPPSHIQNGRRRWQLLASTHRIRKFSVPQLETLMGFDVLPKDTIVSVPATHVASAALKVVAAANAVKQFPIGVPWKKRAPTPFRKAHYEVRHDPKRQVHQYGVDVTLRSLRKAGARAALCRLIGVALAFFCCAVVASWCGLGAGVLTACVCVVTLGLCLPRIMGASVDMLSEAKHSVTVKYRRGPLLAFFVAVLFALVVASLLFAGVDSLGIASSCGLFAGESLVAVLVCGLLAVGAGIFGATRSVSVIIAGKNYGLGVAPIYQVNVEAANEEGQKTKQNIKAIVVGHASCIVQCFIHRCEVGNHVEVERLADGSIFYGQVVAVNIGDGRSIATTYDVLYENGDRENGVERHRIWIKGGHNIIFSVLPTTDETLNQKLCSGFSCPAVLEKAFADVHATTKFNYWDSQSELPEHLQRVIDHSFCTLDKLPEKIAEMIEPHIELVESSCKVLDPVVAFLTGAPRGSPPGVSSLMAPSPAPAPSTGSFVGSDAEVKPVPPKITQCRCGSTTHKRTNHSSCPLNPKNNDAAQDAATRQNLEARYVGLTFVDDDAAGEGAREIVRIEKAGSQWGSQWTAVAAQVANNEDEQPYLVNEALDAMVDAYRCRGDARHEPLEPVPQGRGEKRKAPTSNEPSKRSRRSDSGDEDYQPTAGDAEEEHEEEDY